MIPKRPYLLRAFYDWIVDCGMTPHIQVNALADEVDVPSRYVTDGRIVLNISPTAVQDFIMDNTAVSFSARFGGISYYLYCPVYAIEAVYARESPTNGISFSPDEYASDSVAAAGPTTKTKPKPVLTAVAAHDENTDQEESDAAPIDDYADDGVGTDSDSPTDKNKSSRSPKKRPSLRVIK